MQRFLIGLALISTLLAATLGWKISSLEWRPWLPFDVLGVLWLLGNLPQLVAWALFLGTVGLALYSIILVLRHRGSRW